MIDPLVGTTIGQYEIHAPLGRGGMASVYRGYQPSLGRAVAVKILRLQDARDATFVARFRREARLVAGLMHQNVVPVFDFGEWDGHLYIVMALVSGGTLADRLQDGLPIPAGIKLMAQVADALAYAHSHGVYHRDIKPQNILLASSDWAMVSDFGIARALGESTNLTGQLSTIGTPAYMAPEQWMSAEIDGRADIYALGVVLFEVLTGRKPFTAPTPHALMRQHLDEPVPRLGQLRSDIPPAFDQILQTALAKHADQRFQHAGEMKDALETALRQASPTRTHPRAWPGEHSPSHHTPPYLGPTVPGLLKSDRGQSVAPRDRRQGLGPAGLGMLLVLVTVLAAGIGFLAARSPATTVSSPPPDAPVSVPTITAGPSAGDPTPVQPIAVMPPTATLVLAPTSVSGPGSAGAPTPTLLVRTPPASAPPPTPVPTVAPRIVVPPTATPDRRRAEVERRVTEYFSALNAGDFARAQSVCCTPRWRQQFPLDAWQRNFTGVTDLRFATPPRYLAVEPQWIVAEIDYSFLNSGGSRRYFTLKWTFVPIGADWLVDDSVASSQR